VKELEHDKSQLRTCVEKLEKTLEEARISTQLLQSRVEELRNRTTTQLENDSQRYKEENSADVERLKAERVVHEESIRQLETALQMKVGVLLN
jgi:FtsZ-binding cell division protein ZapB